MQKKRSGSFLQGGQKKPKFTSGGTMIIDRRQNNAKIKAMIRAQSEMKYFDAFKGASSIPASADWTATEFDVAANSLFTPTEGDDIGDRIGRKVEVHKIKMTGLVTCAPQAAQTGADNACLVRIILYQDKQSNGAQAQGEQVMTSSANAAVNPTTYMNADNFGRFQILGSKLMILDNPTICQNGSTTFEQSGLLKIFKFNVNFKKPVPVHFNNTNGGTIADIVDNSFHIIATCSNAALVPQIQYSCRTSYKDL